MAEAAVQVSVTVAGWAERARVARAFTAGVTGPGQTELSRGAVELLVACRQRGVPVGILTAADPRVVAADARRLGIGSLLAWIAGPSQDKAADLRTRTAGTGRVAYVGDTADDVSYARQAGALAVAFTGGYHDADQLREAGPDLTINDLSQFIPLLPAPRT